MKTKNNLKGSETIRRKLADIIAIAIAALLCRLLFILMLHTRDSCGRHGL